MKLKVSIYKDYTIAARNYKAEDMVLLLLESWIHLIHIIMISIYNVDIDNTAINKNLVRLQSQIFKLLPMREEKQE